MKDTVEQSRAFGVLPDAGALTFSVGSVQPLHLNSGRPTLGASDLLVTIGVPVAAVVAAVVFGLVLPGIKRQRQRRQGITLAAFADPSMAAPPRPTRPATPTTGRAVGTETSAPAREAEPQSPYAPPRVATGTMGVAWADPVVPTDQPRLRLESMVERATVAPADTKPPNLRVHRPMDGTLQFLQGRFEVIEGREIGQEIRFVRPPGTGTTEITLGRQEGVPYRHIQLHEPTVSRLHAKLTLEDKDWRLTNLSETNPAGVNGTPLGAQGGSVILRDGDLVEMGEVVFRFRAK